MAINNVKLNKHSKLANCTLFAAIFIFSTDAFSVTRLGIGIGRTTEFLGSADAAFVPYAEFQIDTRIGNFRNNQVGAELDIIKSSSVDTGPILRINTGRNDSVSDGVVAALPEIEASPELGWFVGSGFKLANLGLNSDAIVIGKLSVVGDTGDGHGGTVVNGSVGLVMPINNDFRLIPSVSFNYGDDNYTQAFYGVDAANASTELSEYTASAGVESTQVALVGIRQINEHWYIRGTAAYTILRGDAADSPITKRGDDTQVFTGFTLNYVFPE